MSQQKAAQFKDLTWDDLDAWAGSTIVSRGARYQRSGFVSDLATTQDGALLAWVEGSSRYITLVDISTQTWLHSSCTCPYWSQCKHAVAVVLEYLAKIKAKQTIPQIVASDTRLTLLKQYGAEEHEDEFDNEWNEDGYEEDYEEDYDDDDDDDDDDNYDDAEIAEKPLPSLRTYLEQYDKNQLIGLIETLSRRYPDVIGDLRHQRDLTHGNKQQLLSAVHTEITNIRDDDDYNRRGHLGYYDTSRLEEYLQALLDQGYADELVKIGILLVKVASDRIQYEHEGDSAQGLGDCIVIIFTALAKSTLPVIERMCIALDMQMSDDYDLCYGSEEFWQQDFSSADWSQFADVIQQRLDQQPTTDKDDFHSNYDRNRLSNYLLNALEKAGRGDEIIRLAEREAVRTGSYQRLIDQLLATNQREQAISWIERGVIATQDKSPGIAKGLRETFLQLMVQEQNWLPVAALQADDFFTDPSFHHYQALRQAAQKAKVWPSVEKITMRFLKTGSDYKSAKSPKWPLPEPQIKSTGRKWQQEFPICQTLVDIALADNDPASALHWYKQQGGRSNWYGGNDAKVADAVAEQFPDEAMAIWLKLAQHQIQQTNNRGYEAGVTYLRKIKILLEQSDRTDDWQTVLQAVRKQHKAKRNLMKLLDRLQNSKILS